MHKTDQLSLTYLEAQIGPVEFGRKKLAYVKKTTYSLCNDNFVPRDFREQV